VNHRDELYTTEYKGLLSEVAQKAKKKGLKPDSLRRKFQKHKFITFDPIQGAWINHARLNQIGGDQGGVP
jgi:hypothetical protein